MPLSATFAESLRSALAARLQRQTRLRYAKGDNCGTGVASGGIAWRALEEAGYEIV